MINMQETNRPHLNVNNLPVSLNVKSPVAAGGIVVKNKFKNQFDTKLEPENSARSIPKSKKRSKKKPSKSRKMPLNWNNYIAKKATSPNPSSTENLVKKPSPKSNPDTQTLKAQQKASPQTKALNPANIWRKVTVKLDRTIPSKKKKSKN
jgi:hypothetical protein